MKKVFFACIIAASFIACNNDKDTKAEPSAEKKETTATTPEETKDGSGTFTVDGTNFSGKVSTQTLAQQQFSVLCQQDSPFNLFQATFKDKADFEANKSFKPSGSFMTVDPGTVHISASKDNTEYQTKSSSTGSIEVSGTTITVKDLMLYDNTSDKTITVSATVSF
ncbi:MAG TPA: hypothetical protein VHM26_00150 [Chitinophagaceae bacterium]|jgi:hypothetical protein|nr:hypothetical protein [Chitinophagaceae bacterium]